MQYTEQDIKKIYSVDIRYYVPGADRSKTSSYVKCPNCGEEGHRKGLKVTKNTKFNGAQCFQCNHHMNVVDAVMHYQHMTKKEAIDRIAADEGIEPQEVRRKKKIETISRDIAESFCARQLRESGLTVADVMVKEKRKDGTIIERPAFTSGTIGEKYLPTSDGDDMLIHYLNIKGEAITFSSKHGQRNYIRARWAIPEMHRDKKTDRPMKYQTLPGCGARLYIPQKIRNMYARGEEIETLVIQEGEKKAEKACKHGLPSVAIQGIYMIGNEHGIVNDLQMLLSHCKVQKVVLLFDSDWDNLSSNLNAASNIAERPSSFAGAALKFRDYVRSLYDQGIDVDIYVGHINKTQSGDKGIDDLLVNTLAGREEEITDDMRRAMLASNGEGQWVSVKNVTQWSSTKIYSLWGLDKRDKFFEKYADALKSFNKVRFGKLTYKRNAEGVFETDMDIVSENPVWDLVVEESDTGKVKRKVEFYTDEAFGLLNAAGFRRLMAKDGDRLGDYVFVQLSGDIVTACSTVTIRDYFREYVKESEKDHFVINYFAKAIPKLLADNVLEGIQQMDDDFDEPLSDYERFRYTNCQVRITANDIEAGAPVGRTWKRNVLTRNFTRRPIFKTVELDEQGKWIVETTEDGDKCEFLKFLKLTSDFCQRENMSEKETAELTHYVVNKLTSIGFLLTRYKQEAENKCVLAIDGTDVTVGVSYGRSGKSLIGLALDKMGKHLYVGMRNAGAADQFMFGNVGKDTNTVILDDIPENFDFQQLFTQVTGEKMINEKGGKRTSISYKRAPRILITSNHALKNVDESAISRLIYMPFSNYFNSQYEPIDEFGHTFWGGWDDEQWSLFDNLMCECVQLYLLSVSRNWAGSGKGAVAAPMENVERRQARTDMGETFMLWADEYFSVGGMNVNIRKPRKEVYEAFLAAYPKDAKYYDPRRFFKALMAFCVYNGYHFNINRTDKKGRTFLQFKDSKAPGVFIGGNDKSNSIEYIQITTNHTQDDNNG